jgi:ketosteroid isomerase-like protein
MGEDSESIIQQVFDAYNAKDYDAIEALAADDYELIVAATGEKYSGPEGARRYAEGWLIAFPDAKVEMLNVVASGDWAVAEAVGRGTHSGPMQTPMGEVAPTGKQMELHFCSVAKVRDGKVVEGRDLMPEPAASTA